MGTINGDGHSHIGCNGTFGIDLLSLALHGLSLDDLAHQNTLLLLLFAIALAHIAFTASKICKRVMVKLT